MAQYDVFIHHESHKALIVHEFQEKNGYLEDINMDRLAHMTYRSRHAILMNSALVRHAFYLETDEEYKRKWSNYPYNWEKHL